GTTVPLRVGVRFPLRRGQQPLHRFHRRGDRQALARTNPAVIQRQTPPAMNGAEVMVAAPNLPACLLTLRLRTKHPYPGRIATSGAYGEEQPIKFGYEERSTRSRHRWDSRQTLVRARVENVNHAGAATHIDTMTFRIHKDIVCIATGLDHPNDRTVALIEHAELWRIAKNREHVVRLAIKGHREIAGYATNRPNCNDLA